jgi:hypothetical protein
MAQSLVSQCYQVRIRKSSAYGVFVLELSSSSRRSASWYFVSSFDKSTDLNVQVSPLKIYTLRHLASRNKITQRYRLQTVSSKDNFASPLCTGLSASSRVRSGNGPVHTPIFSEPEVQSSIIHSKQDLRPALERWLATLDSLPRVMRSP